MNLKNYCLNNNETGYKLGTALYDLGQGDIFKIGDVVIQVF